MPFASILPNAMTTRFVSYSGCDRRLGGNMYQHDISESIVCGGLSGGNSITMRASMSAPLAAKEPSTWAEAGCGATAFMMERMGMNTCAEASVSWRLLR